MVELPRAGKVDGSILGRVLDNMTASYKASMAKAIFAHIASGGGQFLPYRDLVRDMLKVMWLPVARYRLRLGYADMTAAYFDKVPERIQLYGRFEDAEPYIDYGVGRIPKILRWPIGIFLGPWLQESGVKFPSADKPAFHAATREAGRAFYLPYEIHPDGLVLDTDFMGYVLGNCALLEGWADMALVDYLQSRNPNIPGIPMKIREVERGPLGVQRRWWTEVMGAVPVNCIYTGKQIDRASFHLDHFLPWRFVAHDRIWNLVPAVPEINLTKGVGIPDEAFVRRLVDVHFSAVETAARIPRLGKDFLDEYVDDLGLSFGQLSDTSAFRQAFEDTVLPLSKLARKRFPVWTP